MASRKRPPIERIPPPPSSWLDLLAASTLDDAAAEATRVDVTGDAPDGERLRLVVQSFEDGASHPLGSVQRAVTARELRAGLQVSLVEVHPRGRAPAARRVIAWVERGAPDLELDGRTSRPRRCLAFGSARGRAPLRLRRRPEAA